MNTYPAGKEYATNSTPEACEPSIMEHIQILNERISKIEARLDARDDTIDHILSDLASLRNRVG